MHSNNQAREHDMDRVLSQLELRERASLLSGSSFWNLPGIERLGIPTLSVSDGPHGLRQQKGLADNLGMGGSEPATCFPTAVNLAATWNPELLGQLGAALAEECRAAGVGVVLGPGINIKRDPRCGRNFEYFSEDPLLSGKLAAAFVRGLQSRGIGASLKHFAVNNQEANRMVVDALVDERALREVYLRAFEIAVSEGQPWTVMSSYNLLNGRYVGEDPVLLEQILREQWGFGGAVISDWGAVSDRLAGLRAGMDLEMPGNQALHTGFIVRAVERAEIDPAYIDRSARRVLELIRKIRHGGTGFAADEIVRIWDANHDLAARIARQSMVLLKNRQDILPLSAAGDWAARAPQRQTSQAEHELPQGGGLADESSDICIIGALAVRPRFQGAGSSQIEPTRVEEPFLALCRYAGRKLPFAEGYALRTVGSEQQRQLLSQAISLASKHSTVLIFAGLPEIYESEGYDREHIDLPSEQDTLIETVATLGKRIIVVLCNGGPLRMPWIDRVDAVLEAYLGGQAAGQAIADILYGAVNPSGKLAETFPLSLDSWPAAQWFPGQPRQVQYRESIFVGYRYAVSRKLPVLFPFGFGLSYTSFAYDELRAVRSDAKGRISQCSVRITNTGGRIGREVVQLYLHREDIVPYRPEMELAAFGSVELEPGESGVVLLDIAERSYSFWDAQAQNWQTLGGYWELRVGASSEDLRQTLRFSVDAPRLPYVESPYLRAELEALAGEQGRVHFEALLGRKIVGPTKLYPFTMNSTLGETSRTPLGWLLIRLVSWQIRQQAGGEPDARLVRMAGKMIRELPLRTLVLMSSGRVTYRLMSGMIAVLNYRFIRAFLIWTGFRSER